MTSGDIRWHQVTSGDIRWHQVYLGMNKENKKKQETSRDLNPEFMENDTNVSARQLFDFPTSDSPDYRETLQDSLRHRSRFSSFFLVKARVQEVDSQKVKPGMERWKDGLWKNRPFPLCRWWWRRRNPTWDGMYMAGRGMARWIPEQSEQSEQQTTCINLPFLIL